jgi:hypothetical protein
VCAGLTRPFPIGDPHGAMHAACESGGAAWWFIVVSCMGFVGGKRFRLAVVKEARGAAQRRGKGKALRARPRRGSEDRLRVPPRGRVRPRGAIPPGAEACRPASSRADTVIADVQIARGAGATGNPTSERIGDEDGSPAKGRRRSGAQRVEQAEVHDVRQHTMGCRGPQGRRVATGVPSRLA